MGTKSFLRFPKNFWWLVAAGVLVANQADKPTVRAIVSRLAALVPASVTPQPPLDVDHLDDSYKAFWQSIASLTPQQRAALRDFYSGLARSLRSDPPSEPVLTTTTSVRTAHRAGLLFLWKGSLDSTSNPSLQSSIEGVLDSVLGRESVPLNPNLRQKSADGFDQMARLCASANR